MESARRGAAAGVVIPLPSITRSECEWDGRRSGAPPAHSPKYSRPHFATVTSRRNRVDFDAAMLGKKADFSWSRASRRR
ncbi:hypothetical protein MRX96_030758 [Rhipicephalus microplus]